MTVKRHDRTENPWLIVHLMMSRLHFSFADQLCIGPATLHDLIFFFYTFFSFSFKDSSLYSAFSSLHLFARSGSDSWISPVYPFPGLANRLFLPGGWRSAWHLVLPFVVAMICTIRIINNFQRSTTLT